MKISRAALLEEYFADTSRDGDDSSDGDEAPVECVCENESRCIQEPTAPGLLTSYVMTNIMASSGISAPCVGVRC